MAGEAASSRRAVGPCRPSRLTRIVPWFLAWFLLAAALHTAGAIPAGVGSALPSLAVVLITIALAAIGLSTRVGDLRRAGHRPLLLGAVVWFTVAVTSLGLQRLTGSW